MAITGGDILEVSWLHPTLGAGFFYPVSGSESTFNKGGLRTNDNSPVDAAGRLIRTMNRQPGKFSLTVASDPVDSQEFDTASTIASDLAEAIWTVALINGAIYKGKGSIEGSLELDGQKSTFPLTVVCGAGLELQ